jgi:Flp pilus assembly protein CpaB
LGKTSTFAIIFLIAISITYVLFNIKHLLPASTPQQTPDIVSIWVASEELDAGQVITEKMLTTQQWPKDFMYAGMVLENDKDKIFEKRLISSLRKGEPVSLHHTDQDQIIKYEKAYTINLERFEETLTSIKQGMYIDFVLTRKLKNQFISETLLENIPIIKMGYNNNNNSKNPSNITLGLTKNQAHLLTLSLSLGKLHLVERGVNGTDGPRIFQESDLFSPKASKNAGVFTQNVTITYGMAPKK